MFKAWSDILWALRRKKNVDSNADGTKCDNEFPEGSLRVAYRF